MKLAIIGSHTDTRTHFDYADDFDVWVFNEAPKEEWVKRADGVFQMHVPTIWRSRTNRNDPKHYDWLKKNKDAIVFMQDDYDDVPMSEKYPLDEIHEMFPKARKYYTSSVAYSIPLALYKGYTEIHVYGVEMETDTEYGHQRPGVAYWIGFADGLGVDLVFHSNKFFNEPLYGYEGTDTIPLSHFEKRAELLGKQKSKFAHDFQELNIEVQQRFDAFADNYQAGYEGLDKEVLELAQRAVEFGTVDGALQAVERYAQNIKTMLEEQDSYLIVRQMYEGQAAGAMQEHPTHVAKLHTLAAHMESKYAELEACTSKSRREKVVQHFKALLAEYIKSSTFVGVCNGVHLENKSLMAVHDKLTKALGGSKAVEVMEVEREKVLDPV